jgi:poly-beta-1,6-N-acetyl-D-glucosamine synthase
VSPFSYALMTAARNEAAFIPLTIDAVLSQSIEPRKWVIVSDGSTDGTDDILIDLARSCRFVSFVRKESGASDACGFGSKVAALGLAYDALRSEPFEYVGNLDADISFDDHYYENILTEMEADTRLGIAGGFVHQLEATGFRNRTTNSVDSIAGAIQLFRRTCFEEIGGYVPLQLGGEDWVAEVSARMRGWRACAFPQYVVRHHKSGHRARGAAREIFRQGRMDYMVGSHPLFEVAKCLRRFKEHPYFVSGFLRYCGYVSCALRGSSRQVPNHIVNHLRHEQLSRLFSPLRLIRFDP